MQRERSFIRRVPEWGRFLAERCLVLPAAAHLPKSWAMRVADAVGFVEARLPTTGPRVVQQEMRAAGFGANELHAAASEHLAWSRRDLVYATRLREGREHTRDWRLREDNGEAIHALLNEGNSLLVVGVHFTEAAALAVNAVLLPDLAGRSILSERPAFSWSPFVLRERLSTGLIYGLGRLMVDPTREMLIPRVGQPGVFHAAVAQLRERRGVAKILVDAYWEKDDGYQRPFAGIQQRGFALGAARIARAAQCHVATYAAIFEDPETVRVEWNTPHEPPPADDEAGDKAFMDMLIDEVERMVGHNPRQYLHPMGSARTWDAATERWC